MSAIGAADAEDAAIGWMVAMRLGTAGPDAEQRLAAWRSAHPCHEAAWQRLQGLQAGMGRVNPLGWTAGQTHAVLEASRQRTEVRSRRLAMVGMVVGVAALLRHNVPPGETAWAYHDTPAALRVQWALANGDRLYLNANTRVKHGPQGEGSAVAVHLLAGEMALLRGQAGALAVTHIETPQLHIGPAGGDVLVRLQDHGCCVAVRAGTASVAWAGGNQQLMPGQALELHQGRVRPWLWQGVDPWAFIDGALSVRQTPLAVFAAELVRHYAQPIVWDGALDGLRVSGVFQLQDLAAVLDLLTRAYPVRVARDGPTWRLRVVV